MLRARGYKLQERPQMLSSMCRLRTMCEMALQCQMSDADVDADVEEEGDETPATVCLSSGSQCLFCSRRAASLPFPEKLGTGNTSQCPCCLQKLGRCVTYFFCSLHVSSTMVQLVWYGFSLAIVPATSTHTRYWHASCNDLLSVCLQTVDACNLRPWFEIPEIFTSWLQPFFSNARILELLKLLSGFVGFVGFVGVVVGCCCWAVVVGPLLLLLLLLRCSCSCCCCCYYYCCLLSCLLLTVDC